MSYLVKIIIKVKENSDLECVEDELASMPEIEEVVSVESLPSAQRGERKFISFRELFDDESEPQDRGISLENPRFNKWDDGPQETVEFAVADA